MQKTIKVKANIKAIDMKLIPKIIWGIDESGFVFVYFKMKDVGTNTYLKEVFSFMYQDPSRIGQNLVLNRMDKIIKYIKEVYPTTRPQHFESKNHMFIKEKIFFEYDKIVRFYNGLVSNLIVEIAENINPKIVNAKRENNEENFSNIVGVLNYYRM